MHSFLIVSGNEEIKRARIDSVVKREKATRQIPFILQKIEDARVLKKIVKFSFSEKCAIILENIDTASHETLNALLKNLEEPNTNIIYILTATNIKNVIPTIVSRCEIIKVQETNNRVEDKNIKRFINSSINDKFEIIGKIKKRTDAITFVENLIYYEKGNKNYTNLESYLNTLKNLKLNGNVSLQLTNLLVKMNSHG